MRIIDVLLASATLVGCVVGDVSPDATLDATTLAHVASYTTLPKLNVQPYMSTVGAFDVNVYVSGDIASYRAIHPDRAGSSVTVGPGTVIVREVLDATGAPSKLTVMAKGWAGYDPTLGDWWFGVTDRQGIPVDAGDGTPEVGRLADCHGCHVDRASDDFLFGVSTAAE